MRNILILGAYSAIAQAAARCFAKDGDVFFLVGRDEEKLKVLAQDLKVRGAGKTEILVADMNDLERHAGILKKAQDFLGDLDTVLVAHGSFSDQKKCEISWSDAEQEIKTNFLSVVSILIPIASDFEKKQKGTIAVITSVAGDRGRPSNYTYGCAKGALSLYLQGLRARLTPSHVNVVTIKPGFVLTPMTAAFKRGFLFASADSVGEGIYQAILKKKDVVYLPGFWRLIMWVINSIPEFIFKKLHL